MVGGGTNGGTFELDGDVGQVFACLGIDHVAKEVGIGGLVGLLDGVFTTGVVLDNGGLSGK